MDSNIFNKNKADLLSENTFLGIEFGSTNIKAILLNHDFEKIESASAKWENILTDDIWSYDLNLAIKKMQECYENLKKAILQKYDCKLKGFKSIGISGMMHGYIVLNDNNEVIDTFRTWRNTNATKAAEILSEEFSFNIPCRWSIAQLYQSILENKKNVHNVRYLTTLSGYIHFLLTEQRVLGICDASGMFPIDNENMCYDKKMVEKFEKLAEDRGYRIDLLNILPKILKAGEIAGHLSDKGAKLLDKSGELKSGILFAPPEGDAGTGMVATNSLSINSGNISVGTSIFSMLILDKKLKNYYRDVDILLSPDANNVAMIHCNNCTSQLNEWVDIFGEVLSLFNVNYDKNELYSRLIDRILDANDDSNILSYGFISAEPIVNINDIIPSIIGLKDSKLNLSNLIKSIIFGCFAPLKIGINFLSKKEDVRADFFMAHGGLLKSKDIIAQMMANIFDCDIGVMENSSQGGAYGMALLAAYTDFCLNNQLSLNEFIKKYIFENENINIYNIDEKKEIYQNLLKKYIENLKRLR